MPNVPPGHKCGSMHGHSFKVEIVVEGEVDPHMGWVYDHAEISRAMEPLLDYIDHKYMNDLPELENPTIEHIAAWFWRKLTPTLPGLAEIVVTRRRPPAAFIAANSALAYWRGRDYPPRRSENC